jgi:hypothetical protein
MIDYNRTILSQYDNSPTMRAIISSIFENIDPTADIDNFYRTVLNLNTASGFGLDIWGRIVGIGRIIEITGTDLIFGFSEASAPATFGEGTFYDPDNVTSSYSLLDDAYRKLIYAKALSNITDVNALSINKLLRVLFSQKCYVTDSHDMTIRYTFEFLLSPIEKGIVNSSVMPRPAGVKTRFLNYEPLTTFGFAEAKAQATFGEGTFINRSAIA